MFQSIDFATIAERCDLPLMLRGEGIEVRNGKAFCPFHMNMNTPALSVYQANGRWNFRCHGEGCDAAGDGIDWVAQRRGIAKEEAARLLGGLGNRDSLKRSATVAMRPTPAAPKPGPKITEDLTASWRSAEWQREADKIICEAEETLWSRAGRGPLAWLRARGLLDFTIRNFRLGFVPERMQTRPIPPPSGSTDKANPITVHRGITLPWLHPEGWYSRNGDSPDPRWRWVGCNLRQLAADPFAKLPNDIDKCWAFNGSRRGYLYPFGDLIPGLPVVLVEGEWDAMIAWQELGWIANIATVGAAKTKPKAIALESLHVCPDFLLAMHNDDAGNAGVKQWAKRANGKAIRLQLPPEVDLNDMHVAGVNLRDWLQGEYAFLRWPWPVPPHAEQPALRTPPEPFIHDDLLSSFHDESDVWEAGRE